MSKKVKVRKSWIRSVNREIYRINRILDKYLLGYRALPEESLISDRDDEERDKKATSICSTMFEQFVNYALEFADKLATGSLTGVEVLIKGLNAEDALTELQYPGDGNRVFRVLSEHSEDEKLYNLEENSRNRTYDDDNQCASPCDECGPKTCMSSEYGICACPDTKPDGKPNGSKDADTEVESCHCGRAGEACEGCQHQDEECMCEYKCNRHYNPTDNKIDEAPDQNDKAANDEEPAKNLAKKSADDILDEAFAIVQDIASSLSGEDKNPVVTGALNPMNDECKED